jgi:hypothetical protein
VAQSATDGDSPIPGTCDELYGLTKTDLDLEFVALLQTGKWKDKREEMIRQKDEWVPKEEKDRTVRDDWPLGKVPTRCVDEVPAWADSVTSLSLDQQKRKLYTHCVEQFEYASVGTDHSFGTFGMPLPGMPAGPRTFYFGGVDKLEDVSSRTKARVYTGMRFGYTVWSYSVTFYLSALLLVVGMLRLLGAFAKAESEMPVVGPLGLEETAALPRHPLRREEAAARDEIARKAYKAAADKAGQAAARSAIFVFAFVGLLLNVVFYSIFIAYPWGFFYPYMPRPECQKRDATHDTYQTFRVEGREPKGMGWKMDTDAVEYELIAFFSQIATIIILAPFVVDIVNWIGMSLTNIRALCTGSPKTQFWSFITNPRDKGVLIGNLAYVGIIGGSIVMIVGQICVNQAFGREWANAIIRADGKESDNDAAVRTISEHLHTQTSASIVAIVACAFTLATCASVPEMTWGKGNKRALSLTIWVLFAVGSVALFMHYILKYGTVVFGNDDASDCDVFEMGSPDRITCDSRAWTFGVGLGMVVVGALLVTGPSLYEAVGSTLQAGGDGTKVDLVVRLKGAAEMAGQVARNARVAASAEVTYHQLPGVYRSESTPFFNFKTTKPSADAFLYPRV